MPRSWAEERAQLLDDAQTLLKEAKATFEQVLPAMEQNTLDPQALILQKQATIFKNLKKAELWQTLGNPQA
jgi:hypothetical protein